MYAKPAQPLTTAGYELLIDGILRICIHMFVKFSHFCQLFSSYKHFGQNTKYSDTGSPAGHIGRGFGAFRALWSVWRALKVFLPAGVDKTISLVSIGEALFCTYVSVTCCLFSSLLLL